MQPIKILITVLLIIFTSQAVFAGPWGTGGGTGATVSTDLTDTANIGRLDATNVFTAQNTFTNIAIPTSSGVVSCPTITDNLDGTITLGADGVVVFQDTLDGTGAFVKLTCTTGAIITPADQTLTFVYANYNAGSPVYATTTNAMDFLADFRKIPVFRVFAEGTHFHINDYDEPGILGSSKALFKDVTLNGFQRASGLVLSTSGTRISTISAGTTWFGVKFQSLTENVSGTTGELYEYYRTAGVWGSSLVTSYDSIYYSDGTDRQTLGTAKYVAKYFYMGVEDDNHAYYIHGNTHNSAALALAEPAPVTPAVISSHSLYVGKIVILQGSTTGTAYPRVWDQALQVSGVTDHDDLTGIDSAGTGVLYGHVNADAQTIYGAKTFNSTITGSVDGNAGTVTNATLTTALTVDTGTVGLTGNAANSSVLTLGSGASSVSGTNTGDQVGDGVTITGAGTVGDPFVSVATGTGDVVGPASAVDNNIAVFDGITGKLVKDSGATIDSNGISLSPAVGGGGIIFTDSSAPGTDKEMAEITGGYGTGADTAENAFLIFWAKIAGTMTNIFNYTPATDTIDFHKPTTFQAGDIVNAEIADGTIEADKLEATNSLVDNYIPSYDSASGGFTWVAGGAISITEQSNDPTYNELSTGDMVVATTSGDMFYKSATGLYTIPGVYALDPTTPTLVSATVSDNIDGINSDLTLVFSESITVGTGGNGGVTLNTPTSAGTYVSGDVSTTLLYSLATPILSTDTPTITYTQPGDGLESTAAGIDVATITEGAVTNSSTYSGSVAFTTVISGNINDGATFGNASPGVAGVDFPRSTGGDTFIVASGDELTIPTGSSITTSGVLADSLSADHGKLIIVGSLTLDGNLVVNDWDELIMNAGSSLDLAGNDVVHSQGNGDIMWFSYNGTVGSRVTVTSTVPGGRITNAASGLATGIYLTATYTDFSDLGDSQIMQGSSLVETTTCSITNSTFTNHGDLDFMFSSAGEQEFTIENCDFREPTAAGKQVNIACLGTPTGLEVRKLNNCTFSSSLYYGDIDADAEGMSITNIIRNNYMLSVREPNITIVGDFSHNSISIGATATSISAGSTADTTDYQDSYIYMAVNNARPITLPATIASTIKGNIFETTTAVDESNIIIINSGDATIEQNLAIGECTLVTALSVRAGTYNIRRNTVFTNGVATSGMLLGTEGSGSLVGSTTNLYSNLVVDSDTTSNDYGVYMVLSTIDQITNTDYNNFYGVSGGDVFDRYYNVTMTGRTEGVDAGFALNDLNLNPSFVDTSRTIATWDTSLGGVGTAVNAITEMLKLNTAGYNTSYSLAALRTYIKAGFTPTNAGLNGTGYLGDDIGAVDF